MTARTDVAAGMDVWTQMLKRAVVGTTRQGGPLPDLPAELAALLPQAAADAHAGELATRLLTAAGLLALWREAGRRPTPLESDATARDAAPQLPAQPCSAAASALLRRLLAGEYAAALAVWLDQARGYRQAPPPVLVPALLDALTRRPELQATGAAVTGDLGAWLARRNPAWRWVLSARDDAADPLPPRRLWDEGAPTERLTWLRLARRLAPADARAAVETAWPAEAAKFRAQILEVLATAPDPADEAFLEAALDDRSKLVRSVAAEALGRLPDSALQRRLQRATLELVDLEPASGRVLLTFPESFPEAWARDGIEEKAPPGMGQRAWWLRQMITRLPPERWTRAWEREPRQILAADLGDWADDLRLAWTEAAVAWQDRAWAAALLADMQTRADDAFRQADALGALLPQSAAQHLLDAAISQQRLPPRWLLARHRAEWSPALCRIATLATLKLLGPAQAPRQIAHAYQCPEEIVELLCRAAVQMPRRELLQLADQIAGIPTAPDWQLAVADDLREVLQTRDSLLGLLDLESVLAALDFPRPPLPAPVEALHELAFRLRILRAFQSDGAGAGGSGFR